MEQTKLCTVTVGETARAYPYGTTYQTIAADFQEQYENDILLVSRNGKLCELNKTLHPGHNHSKGQARHPNLRAKRGFSDAQGLL